MQSIRVPHSRHSVAHASINLSRKVLPVRRIHHLIRISMHSPFDTKGRGDRRDELLFFKIVAFPTLVRFRTDRYSLWFFPLT